MGRELIRELTPHRETTKVSLLDLPITGLPSIVELSEKITVSKPFEIIGPVPEFRLTENDQTDPAGRYRFRVSSDNFFLEHATAALWVSDHDIFTFSHTNSRIDIDATHGTSWGLNLYATNTSVRLLGNSTAGSAYTAIYGGVTAYLVVYGDGVIQFVSTPTFLTGFSAIGGSSVVVADTPLQLRCTTNAASNLVEILSSYRSGTAANNDEGYVSYMLKTSAPSQSEFARVTWVAVDKTDNSKDGQLEWAVMVNNTLTDSLRLGSDGTNLTTGFFGTGPVVRPTGVAVTAAGIHAALVTLGLITA